MRTTVIALVVSAGTLMACGGGASGEEIEACIERGVAYFKEIGSYPLLLAPMYEGRKAEDVASERCNRTTTAF